MFILHHLLLVLAHPRRLIITAKNSSNCQQYCTNGLGRIKSLKLSVHHSGSCTQFFDQHTHTIVLAVLCVAICVYSGRDFKFKIIQLILCIVSSTRQLISTVCLSVVVASPVVAVAVSPSDSSL